MKLSRDELIRLVHLVSAGKGTEGQINEWIAILKDGCSDPRLLDYIFWPDCAMTPEEIADRALAYRPIEIPPDAIGEPERDQTE